jgi:hypothetical protein
MRIKGWEQVLDKTLREAEGLSFGYGVNDCCIWATSVAQALTKVDWGKDLRGKYDSAFGAAKLMKEVGGEGIESTIDATVKKFGIEEVHPLRASRGDLVMVRAQGKSDEAHIVEFLKDGSITALAVVEMDGRNAATFSPDGLIHVPHAYWVRGFRV